MPNRPTFNKSTQGGTSEGYYSRVLFMYSVDSVSPPVEYYGTDLTDAVDADGIGLLISNTPYLCHGNYTLPEKYWDDGKIIRISGTLSVNIVGNAAANRFHMRFGVEDVNTSTVYWLAAQNDFTDTGWFAESQIINIVQFEAHLTRTANNGDGFMSCVGYYAYYNEYQLINLGPEVYSDSTRVPIWKSGNTPDTTVDIIKPKILWNLYGTVAGIDAEIYVNRLIIEELA